MTPTAPCGARADVRRRTLALDATLANEQAAQEALGAFLEGTGCPPKALRALRLALEELFVNVAHYAYAPATGPIEVAFTLDADGGGATIVLCDRGVAFDPFGRDDPQPPTSAQEAKVGGLGILMVKRLMDAYGYERTAAGENVVTIQKRW